MIVVDASVAAKWIMPEFGSDRARALLNDEEPITAPDLLQIEVAAAIVRRVRNGGMTPAEATSRLALWNRTVQLVNLMPCEFLLNEAATLAIAMRHPLQDCLYLVLARQGDALLVTADRRFAERSAAHHSKVELIAPD